VKRCLFVIALSLSMFALVACEEAGPEPIELTMKLTVPPHTELYRCQLYRLPTGSELFVSGGEHEYGAGVHHYLLFRTSLDPAVDRPMTGMPTECYGAGGVMEIARGYVSGGQTPTESADFPPGVAYPFRPGEILLLQAHYQNVGDAPVDATVRVTLRTTTADTVTTRAGTLRFYNPFIYVPAHQTAAAAMRCQIPHDITILSAASHMHKRGVGWQAFLDRPGFPAANSPFYDVSDWQQPETFLGPLTVKAGSSLRFRCDYLNDGDHPFVQGLSADDNEMCMFSAIYYPAMDEATESCVSMDLHGTGTRSCKDTTSCVEACPPESRPHLSISSAEVGECWQKCIVESCPNVTHALFPQLKCTEDKCSRECATSGPACTACVTERCYPEAAACQVQACGD
jgi:Copper type II ascorbate-dependent monooxygenase, C-terminal domain